MSSTDLGGPLLKSVSRSFYLTIRVLPSHLRAPIGLGYLLARASDTIADSADVSTAERREHLAAFKAAIDYGDRAALQTLQQRIRSQHEGENRLMAQLPAALDWLTSLDAFDQQQIRCVLSKIVHGQDLDLVRFSNAAQLTALKSPEELEEYTYLVAGCVGEFWTDVCLHHLPRYSSIPNDELCELGKDFGKGLQLVNILRDLPRDLAAGRCYLPVDAAAVREVVTPWRLRAETLLESGRRYLASLYPARLRIAVYLPWELGRQTLTLLAQQSPLETEQRIKVSRSAVRNALLRSAIVAFSNLPLSR